MFSFFVFFFKQKTAYEMRISDWSSDVCSSDLDGLTLPSYLTLPTNTKLGDNGMPAAPVPMVLLVHGGPWLRDDLAFDPQHAWLADRGYAVLSVNFRASGGFGSDFMAKGDRQWSGTMHDDLLDGVQDRKSTR